MPARNCQSGYTGAEGSPRGGDLRQRLSLVGFCKSSSAQRTSRCDNVLGGMAAWKKAGLPVTKE